MRTVYLHSNALWRLESVRSLACLWWVEGSIACVCLPVKSPIQNIYRFGDVRHLFQYPDPKAQKGHFVGYNTWTKAYCLWQLCSLGTCLNLMMRKLSPMTNYGLKLNMTSSLILLLSLLPLSSTQDPYDSDGKIPTHHPSTSPSPLPSSIPATTPLPLLAVPQVAAPLALPVASVPDATSTHFYSLHASPSCS
jgi:hypothetical protein